MTEDAEIGIISYGSSSRSAKTALKMARDAGIKVGMIRLQTIWPFPVKRLNEFGKQVSKLIVPELNLGQIAHEVEHAVQSFDKVVKVNKINGEPIHPNEIFEKLKGE